MDDEDAYVTTVECPRCGGDAKREITPDETSNGLVRGVPEVACAACGYWKSESVYATTTGE